MTPEEIRAMLPDIGIGAAEYLSAVCRANSAELKAARLREEVDRLARERDESRAEVARLRHGCAACGTSKDMRGVNLENGHRFTLCRDCRELAPAALPMTSTEVRLRRLALVPMAPGEVPEKPGWYVVDSGKPVQVWLDDCDNFGGAQEPFVWDVDAQCAVPVTDWAGRWLARIPVDALTTD